MSANHSSWTGWSKWRREQRLVPEERAEDRVGDDRGEGAGQQRGGLEVVPVHDVGGQHRAAERRAEDRPIPEPIPTETAIRPSSGPRSRTRAQQRPETGADLGGRPLPAARPAGPDRQGRRDDLDDHGSQADAPRVPVHRVDRGVGPVSFRLGRPGEHQNAGGQGPEPGHQRDGPWPGEARRSGCPALAGRRRDVIAGQRAEQDMGGQLERLVEHDRPEPGDDADEGPQDEPLGQERLALDSGAGPGAGPAGGPPHRGPPRPHRGPVWPAAPDGDPGHSCILQ
jgi:hypothetical protein